MSIVMVAYHISELVGRLIILVWEKKLGKRRKKTMPNIIAPSKEMLRSTQAKLRMVLVISRAHTGNVLVSALAHTMPTLFVSVYSSQEALEVTEAIKPDVLVLESDFRDELNGVELYERLHMQPGFNKIPAILIGQLTPEQHRSLVKRTVVNLPYPVELPDLQSTLETLLNIPRMPIRPDVMVAFKQSSPSPV